MGNRYVITGSQIGEIYALLDFNEKEKIRKILQEILDNQEIAMVR